MSEPDYEAFYDVMMIAMRVGRTSQMSGEAQTKAAHFTKLSRPLRRWAKSTFPTDPSPTSQGRKDEA